MSRGAKVYITVIMFLLAAAAPSLRALWIENGNPLCTSSGDQYNAVSIVNDSGYTIVAWTDMRDPGYDIYAQKVTPSGSPLWNPDGVPICTDVYSQTSPAITADGQGGAIITWTDSRGADGGNIYAQRIDASGVVQWAEDGVPVCIAAGSQGKSGCEAGVCGAIVIWEDDRNGSDDIYVQRLDAMGNALWTVNGIPVTVASDSQIRAKLAYSAADNRYSVVWQDLRGGDYDIYAQSFDTLGTMYWTANGQPVCQASGNQIYPDIAVDLMGNTSIVWQDSRNSNYDIYAQVLQNTGTAAWTVDGVGVCTDPGSAEFPVVISPGSYELIVAWRDQRNGNYDIYAQRVGLTGDGIWATDGVAVCQQESAQHYPRIVSDGGNGAVISWHDSRNGVSYDIYAQKLDGLGMVQWTFGGVAVRATTGTGNEHSIGPDGNGGAVLVWRDTRNGDLDIYISWIYKDGRIGFLPPEILTVNDVPGDQGGWARINFKRSLMDAADESYAPVDEYGVYRRIDDALLLARITEEGNLADAGHSPFTVELDGRRFVTAASAGVPPGTWEVVATVPAHQEDDYWCLVPTAADSSAVLRHSVYCISAETTVPSIYFFSPPDSGYSVDNIAPGVPLGLAVAYNTGSGNQLAWDPNGEPDFQYYRIYRGADESFVPAPGTEVHSTVDPNWTDPDNHGSGVFYKVTAVDYVGNESSAASPSVTTDSGDPRVPKAFALGQNVPNPFNPSTTVYYDVPDGGGDVSIRVFDVSGRLVRTLVDSRQTAGAKSVTWNGSNDRGQSVSSGIYFYRMTAPGFTRTRKMVLLR